MSKLIVAISLSILFMQTVNIAASDDLWVTYAGDPLKTGHGKRIVLVSGDDEYRSEEALPMLGKILARRHGFDCAVLFSVDPETRTIHPEEKTNIPGIHLLDDADLMIIATRFRELPDADMKHLDDYVNSGRPIIGLRTATHAFNYNKNKQSPYAKYSFNSTEWPGGFGQQVLGDTWISHHGYHKRESTRGVINKEFQGHPILRGVKDVWGPTDVYGVKNLGPEAVVLMHGAVLEGMSPDDKPVAGAKNDPMMPVFWTRSFTGRSGNPSRVVCTTMGSSTDFESEGLRRAVVNACYWGLGMEDQIPAESDVEYVGDYHPTEYGFGSFTPGVKPATYRLD